MAMGAAGIIVTGDGNAARIVDAGAAPVPMAINQASPINSGACFSKSSVAPGSRSRRLDHGAPLFLSVYPGGCYFLNVPCS
ncbi:MAG: hypothetical protein JW768_15865 [Chitinispirillaceae bacterium]|nr:hypothetical protein [Chitinispirillaceae bacterium]